MENNITVIEKYCAPKWILFLGTLIQLPIYIAIIIFTYAGLEFFWESVSGLPVEPPVIGFMSSYSKPSQNGYWVFVISSLIAGLMLSPIFTSMLGASLGKWLFGIRYVDLNGNKATFLQSCRKVLSYFILFLIVALPGPVLGFIFGSAADGYSLLALFLGTLAVIFIYLFPDNSGRVWPYVKAGMVPIFKKNIEAFRDEMARSS